jgi:hypothetical protein
VAIQIAALFARTECWALAGAWTFRRVKGASAPADLWVPGDCAVTYVHCEHSASSGDLVQLVPPRLVGIPANQEPPAAR